MQSNRPGTAAGFVEEDGRVIVTVLVQHGSKDYRDAHAAYGMEGGMHEGAGLPRADRAFLCPDLDVYCNMAAGKAMTDPCWTYQFRQDVMIRQ